MGVAFCANDPASQSILPNSQTVTMLLCREQLYLAPNRTPFEDSGTCHPRHPVQHSSWACQPDPSKTGQLRQGHSRDQSLVAEKYGDSFARHLSVGTAFKNRREMDENLPSAGNNSTGQRILKKRQANGFLANL